MFLVEDCSVRTVERITGIYRDAILKLLVIAGARCEALMASRVRNVQVSEVQADEAWAFIGKKEGHKRPSEVNGDSIGDCYTWIAIESVTKLVLDFSVGRRTSDPACYFRSALSVDHGRPASLLARRR